MGSTQHETTLEMLMSRLAALEQRNTALEQEVVTLRKQLPPVQAVKEHSAPSQNGRVRESGGHTSRRTLLRRAAGAAVATVTAGAMLGQGTDTSSAHSSTPAISPDEVYAHHLNANNHDGIEALRVDTTSNAQPAALCANHGSAPGAHGSSRGTGVLGAVWAVDSVETTSGVRGTNNGRGAGVRGENPFSTGPGVHGVGSPGVKGESSASSGIGVRGVSPKDKGGRGVQGEGDNGVVGYSSRAGWAATYGENRDTTTGGYGVYGVGRGAAHAGTFGQNLAGDGVRGEGKTGVHGKSGTAGGNAVWGEATGSATGVSGQSASGYGGQFRGGKAQVRLVPASTAGKPTTGAHTKGELFMDSTATLFVCTASGTPGTWKRVSMS